MPAKEMDESTLLAKYKQIKQSKQLVHWFVATRKKGRCVKLRRRQFLARYITSELFCLDRPWCFQNRYSSLRKSRGVAFERGGRLNVYSAVFIQVAVLGRFRLDEKLQVTDQVSVCNLKITNSVIQSLHLSRKSINQSINSAINQRNQRVKYC